MKYRKFEKSLLDDLKDLNEAKLYLLNAVEEEDEEFLLDAMKLIIKAHGPTKISEMAGGDKQKWSALKNPTYSTINQFLNAFGLKLGAIEKPSVA